MSLKKIKERKEFFNEQKKEKKIDAKIHQGQISLPRIHARKGSPEPFRPDPTNLCDTHRKFSEFYHFLGFSRPVFDKRELRSVDLHAKSRYPEKGCYDCKLLPLCSNLSVLAPRQRIHGSVPSRHSKVPKNDKSMLHRRRAKGAFKETDKLQRNRIPDVGIY
jgi:hypothetical protein